MSLNHSPRIVTSGLVFFYDAANQKCYPGTGTTVTDMIGNSVGESVNSPTYVTDKNGYFSFATNNYLRFPENSALNTQTVTVEVWARTNALSQDGFWFEKGTVNSQYSLFQAGTTILWRANLGSGFVNLIVLNTASSYINTNDWFNIVATFVSGVQRVYINGSQVGSGTVSGTIATNTNGMSIGAYGGYTGGRGYYYNGDIGVVKVYNTVLSLLDVKQNFQALRGRYGI